MKFWFLEFCIKKIVLILLIIVASHSRVSFAEDSSLDDLSKNATVQAHASIIKLNPDLWGLELNSSYLMKPIEDRAIFLGPRIGFVYANGSNQSRTIGLLGGEGQLWFVNAFGLGLGVDLMPVYITHFRAESSSTVDLFHFRLNPFFSTRFARFHGNGAWAVRFGMTYDTLYQWGAQLGISLQIDQVPQVRID